MSTANARSICGAADELNPATLERILNLQDVLRTAWGHAVMAFKAADRR